MYFVLYFVSQTDDNARESFAKLEYFEVEQFYG